MKHSSKQLTLLAIVSLGLIVGLKLLLQHPTKLQVTATKISQEYYAGPFKVQIAINPEQPRVGKNQLKLIIRDKDDQALSNASINAVAEMPAMGSMPTMYAPAKIINEAPSFYQGQFELPMMGPWPLTVTINTGTQEQAKLTFDMGTSRKGLSLASATPGTLAAQSGNHTSSLASPASLQPQTFKVDAYRRQLIGVTTEEVTCINMTKSIQVSAEISYDQTRLTDISLKFDGWIEQLNADYVGKRVKQGQALFTVYSPELISSQDEYLHSYKRSQTDRNSLKAAAAKRLSLWGINHSQIRALEKRGHSLANLPILSPLSGTVIEKNIVTGSAFKAGSTLLRIADLSTIWVEGQVYEADLPWIELGMMADVILENRPDDPLTGKVTFIEPFLENETRAARVRVELPNTDGILRPDQYVQLQLQANLGERLVVPEQAVVYSGANRIVFVDLGDGRLQAKNIKTGVRNDDYIEVVAGLNYNDVIVSSGNFLIASESKLKSGSDQW